MHVLVPFHAEGCLSESTSAGLGKVESVERSPMDDRLESKTSFAAMQDLEGGAAQTAKVLVEGVDEQLPVKVMEQAAQEGVEAVSEMLKSTESKEKEGEGTIATLLDPSDSPDVLLSFLKEKHKKKRQAPVQGKLLLHYYS